MMLRRDAFEQVGGFAEEFFMYGEDSEWCMRLKRAGRRIVYCPLGVVYHVGSVSADVPIWQATASVLGSTNQPL